MCNDTMKLHPKHVKSSNRKSGDMWWVDWNDKSGCYCDWDNCEGKYLVVVLPNGVTWNSHGRASNCTKTDDHTHRCWILHGEPPNITVDKDGETCAAGAGSIVVGNWHGYIRNGAFVNA